VLEIVFNSGAWPLRGWDDRQDGQQNQKQPCWNAKEDELHQATLIAHSVADGTNSWDKPICDVLILA
jgi:hypothetical protein